MPHQARRVAEVVRVPGVAPQAGVEHLALRRGVGAEAVQLPVADGLEEEAHRQTTTPTHSSQPTSGLSNIATCTGSDTNHMIARLRR